MLIKTFWTFSPAYGQKRRNHLELTLHRDYLIPWLAERYPRALAALQRNEKANSAGLNEGFQTDIIMQTRKSGCAYVSRSAEQSIPKPGFVSDLPTTSANSTTSIWPTGRPGTKQKSTPRAHKKRSDDSRAGRIFFHPTPKARGQRTKRSLPSFFSLKEEENRDISFFTYSL
jgi:hypothetical protein